MGLQGVGHNLATQQQQTSSAFRDGNIIENENNIIMVCSYWVPPQGFSVTDCH